MQTVQLRTLVDPKQAQQLLDSYIIRSALLPQAARKQVDLVRLPLALQEQADQATERGQVWSAWSCSPAAWLFVGELNLSRSRERRLPVLEIEIYDYDRRTRNRITAMRGRDGAWQALND